MESLLRDLGPKVASRIGDSALRAAARPIIKEARRLVPVDTGALKKSIVAKTERKGRKANERLVVIGFRQPRSRIAHLIEYGSSKMAARPFIRPAMDARAQDALTAMSERLAQGIEREEWKRAVAESDGEVIEIE